MRHLILWSCLLAAAWDASQDLSAAPASTSAELRQQQVLWRSHFVGSARLETDFQATRWVKLAADPASMRLREQTLGKLATAPFRALRSSLGAGAKDHADLLQPLFEDLFRAESYAEWRGTSNQTIQFALALKLPDDRAKAWITNLSVVIKSWTGIDPVPFDKDGVSGWQLRKHDALGLIRVARSGQWVAVGLGQGTLTLFNDYVGRLRTGVAPFATDGRAWGELWADWPQVQPRLPFHLPVHVPCSHLSVSGKDDTLLIKGVLDLQSDLIWRPASWCPPTNLIHQPLVSFTAARGVAPLLRGVEALSELKLQPVPDEVYVWAMNGIFSRTFTAARTANAAAEMKRVGPRLMASNNSVLERWKLGSLTMLTNAPAVIWQGAPFIYPHLGPFQQGKTEYFFGGLASNARTGLPPSRELLNQFERRPELAYYDWELTEPRLQQWKALAQLYQIFAHQPMIAPAMAGFKWLDVAGKGAGNTVTEITVSGPRELVLTRKAPLGLTGFELVMLCNWLESANFPFSPYVPPQPPGSRPAPAAKPAAAKTPPKR